MIVALALAGALALPPAVSAATPDAAAPPPDDVTVDVLSVSGSGCPVGTVRLDLDPVAQERRTDLTLIFSEFMAAIGTGTSPTDGRKNCQLALAVNAPAGYSYAIAEIRWTGEVGLAEGATAVLRHNHYVAGSTSPEPMVRQLAGPLEGAWSQAVEIERADRVFSPCDGPATLNLSTELRIDAGTSDVDGTGSFISLNAEVLPSVALVWRRC